MQTHWTQYSDCNTEFQLYLSLVHPHTEYAAPVWDSHLLSDINSLENVQKFALRVCCKQWDTACSELLSWSNVPSLENRRLYLKLCHLFKIINNICYFNSLLELWSLIPIFLIPQGLYCYNSLFNLCNKCICGLNIEFGLWLLSWIPFELRLIYYLVLWFHVCHLTLLTCILVSFRVHRCYFLGLYHTRPHLLIFGFLFFCCIGLAGYWAILIWP